MKKKKTLNLIKELGKVQKAKKPKDDNLKATQPTTEKRPNLTYSKPVNPILDQLTIEEVEELEDLEEQEWKNSQEYKAMKKWVDEMYAKNLTLNQFLQTVNEWGNDWSFEIREGAMSQEDGTTYQGEMVFLFHEAKGYPLCAFPSVEPVIIPKECYWEIALW